MRKLKLLVMTSIVSSATTGCILPDYAEGELARSGGAPSIGGSKPTGGKASTTPASGGSSPAATSSSGGRDGTTPSTVSGGSSVAGSQAIGGAQSGGVASTGGTLTANGGVVSGGSPSIGGSSSAGGTLAMGGTRTAVSTGGAITSGGAPETGGRPTGGALLTGGTVATGGTRATGGLPAAGGTLATGGTAVTGGIETGGLPETGGAAMTGGACSTGGTGNPAFQNCATGRPCAVGIYQNVPVMVSSDVSQQWFLLPLSAGTMFAYQYPLRSGSVVTQLGLFVSSASRVTSGSFKLALYESDTSNTRPGALVATTGTLQAPVVGGACVNNTPVSGAIDYTVPQSSTTPLYWFAVLPVDPVAAVVENSGLTQATLCFAGETTWPDPAAGSDSSCIPPNRDSYLGVVPTFFAILQ